MENIRKLELTISAMLPYKLMVKTNYGIAELIEYNSRFNLINTKPNINPFSNKTSLIQVKPILRPLSDLTIDFYWKNLEDGDCELNEEKIEEIKTTPRGYLKLYQLNYLYKHHFDIYNLIENNLAIDINTL